MELAEDRRWAKLSRTDEQPIQKETAPYSGRGG